MLDAHEEIGEGFRPTDTQLAAHFLMLMLQGYYWLVAKIPLVDIYKHEPWDLPYHSGLSLSRSEWYFFCPRHDQNGSCTSRLTNEGSWKSTGKDRVIKDEAERETFFKKKSLVYHKRRSRCGEKNNWVIHEIRATLDDGRTTQGAYVLCKLMKKPDKNVKVSTDSQGEPSSRMAPKHDHLLTEANSEFSASTSCKRKFDGPLSTFGEEHSRSSSCRQAVNVGDEPIHPTDFETSYLSLHGENNASSYTTSPEEIMVGQQSDVSFIGDNKQRYGLDPIPESYVTPEFDDLSVFDYGQLHNVGDEPIHPTDFETSYLSSHGENNASSYTTSPEEAMVGQQSDVSFIGDNKQRYGLDPTPESYVTPEFDELLVFDYGQLHNVGDEPIHPTDFETSYLSLHGENNASSYTTSPEEVMVGQQSDVSFIGDNKQRYGLDPIPESYVTPEFDDLSVFDYGQLHNVGDEPIHPTDIETSYLSSHGENNASSYTTSPEEAMVGQQSDVSFIGDNKQRYGLDPTPESYVTPEFDELLVFDYGQLHNVGDEPIHPTDFETSYLSLHGENNASSYTTSPEEVMVGQQSDVSFIGDNKQRYGLDPTPESYVTPKFDELLVFDYGQLHNVGDEPIHPTDFETSYLSSHGENNASSYTTSPEEAMVGQQSDVSFIGDNKQRYGLDPTPESYVTPEFDELLVFDYGQLHNVGDEPIHPTDFETSYLSSHGENNASSYTTSPEEAMVGQQSDVSFIGDNKQRYGLDPTPESYVTPKFDELLVFDYGQLHNVGDEPIHPTDFENSYLSLHGENNASSYTTSPEEAMVGQQSNVSFIGDNKQRYGLDPIPESYVTPEFDELSVFDYSQLHNVGDEPIHPTDFETSYLSSHGENNASYTTSPEEVMVGQQSDASFIGGNKQCYGLDPIPGSSVTPEFDEPSVLVHGFWN